jgi:hypothetical protein
MEVTLLGMVTLVNAQQSSNAPPPMEVTAPLTPGIEEDIVTAPPGPVYPMMVMSVPLTV